MPTKEEGTTITKLTLFQTVNPDTQADEYLIYQKETGAGNVYSKYTFDENHQLTGKTQMSLVDLANEESSATRDINGDGVIGANSMCWIGITNFRNEVPKTFAISISHVNTNKMYGRILIQNSF